METTMAAICKWQDGVCVKDQNKNSVTSVATNTNLSLFERAAKITRIGFTAGDIHRVYSLVLNITTMTIIFVIISFMLKVEKAVHTYTEMLLVCSDSIFRAINAKQLPADSKMLTVQLCLPHQQWNTRLYGPSRHWTLSSPLSDWCVGSCCWLSSYNDLRMQRENLLRAIQPNGQMWPAWLYLENCDSYGNSGDDDRVVFNQLYNVFKAAVDLLQGEGDEKMSVGANVGYLWLQDFLVTHRCHCLILGAWSTCNVATVVWINFIVVDEGGVSEVRVVWESTALQLKQKQSSLNTDWLNKPAHKKKKKIEEKEDLSQ